MRTRVLEIDYKGKTSEYFPQYRKGFRDISLDTNFNWYILSMFGISLVFGLMSYGFYLDNENEVVFMSISLWSIFIGIIHFYIFRFNIWTYYYNSRDIVFKNSYDLANEYNNKFIREEEVRVNLIETDRINNKIISQKIW